jgi:Flp pilus assembly protein TadB
MMRDPLVALGAAFAAAVVLAAVLRWTAPERAAKRRERRRMVAAWQQRRRENDAEWQAIRDTCKDYDDILPATTDDDLEGP